MSRERIIDLFWLLFRNSLVHERGLAVALGDDCVQLTRNGNLIGVWSCEGDNLVWSPTGSDQCEIHSTVTEAVNRTMTDL